MRREALALTAGGAARDAWCRGFEARRRTARAVLLVVPLAVVDLRRHRFAVVRLGAASGIVLCSGFALKDASSEAILRVAALGAATQLYGAL